MGYLAQNFGHQIKMNSAYHLETNAQIERTNHTLEDILRNYVEHK
jgi:hypothetical protein